MRTLGGSALESALESTNYNTESVVSTTDFVRVGRLPVLNMFNIYTPIQSANSSLPTIAVGQLQISIVGMGLKRDPKC